MYVNQFFYFYRHDGQLAADNNWPQHIRQGQGFLPAESKTLGKVMSEKFQNQNCVCKSHI